ncbi:MAG: GNAT family N-acetyltransferase [Hyphomicrobium sp.]
MSDPSETIVKLVPAIADVAAAAWDACANADPATYNPFVAHAFLKALEDAGCVGQGTGWLPRHLVLENADGSVSGVAPCYVKGNSQGEYVFDHAWAEAYHQAGGRYYPKLQISVPFTPVPGPRLLVRPSAAAHADEQVLAAAAIEIAKQNGLSSVHLTFLDKATQQRLSGLGYLARTGQQFHWQNQDYKTFEDFLSTFASRKRKSVRKERAEALSPGIEIEHVTGAAITGEHWDAFYEFYMDTGARKWGRPYLNRKFFSALGETMAERCLLVMARRDGRYIAGALNMIGGDCLYGRYWGAIEQHPSLHFEVCYYQAIDYAITHGLARVEAGAQGEHKLARGYLPVETYSAHWLAEPGLHRAVEKFLKRERAMVAESNDALTEMGPYKQEMDRRETD